MSKICNIYFLAAVLPLILMALCSHCAFSEVMQSTNSYLSMADRMHLKNILESGFQLDDVPSVYYAVSGYKLLGEVVSKADVIFLLYISIIFKDLACTNYDEKNNIEIL